MMRPPSLIVFSHLTLRSSTGGSYFTDYVLQIISEANGCCYKAKGQNTQACTAFQF